MHAMLMKESCQKLIYSEIKRPVPNAHQILIKVTACGICRTDLHVVDGELKHPKLPLVPDHQIIACQLGATWAGDSDQSPPRLLDAAIIFAPVGSRVPLALKNTIKGGIVVCAGIHMSDIPSFSYELLWGERTLCSIANLTRKDGAEFLSLAPTIPVKTEIHTYALKDVNLALEDLRHGRFTGSAVIVI